MRWLKYYFSICAICELVHLYEYEIKCIKTFHERNMHSWYRSESASLCSLFMAYCAELFKIIHAPLSVCARFFIAVTCDCASIFLYCCIHKTVKSQWIEILCISSVQSEVLVWSVSTHWGVRSAHADPVCHLWACAVVSSCQHCPGQEILTFQTSCTALKQISFSLIDLYSHCSAARNITVQKTLDTNIRFCSLTSPVMWRFLTSWNSR